MAHYVEAPPRKRHPIRGLIAGFLLGLGLLLLLIVYGKAPWKSGSPYMIFLGVCTLIGLLVGLFGPTRRKR